jgi:hypothetical protein
MRRVAINTFLAELLLATLKHFSKLQDIVSFSDASGVAIT